MASKATEHLNLSEEQNATLEENFKKLSRHPDGMVLMLIAAECNLTEEETKVSPRRSFHRKTIIPALYFIMQHLK